MDFEYQDESITLDYYESGWFDGFIAVLVHMRPIILITFLARLLHLLLDLTLGTKTKSLKPVITYVIACYQVHLFFEGSKVQLGVHAVFLLFLIQEMKKSDYMKRIISCNLCILINECLIHKYGFNELIRLRPILMTIVMKHISYKEDTDLKDRLVYYMHPASIIFGPWHPIFEKAPVDLRNVLLQFWRSIKSLGCGIFILFLSTLLSEYAEVITNPISKIYLRALEFRLSHYFICFLGQSFIALWSTKEQEICKISKIEWPRSLVEVVVYWNISMHRWLKEFCFRPIKHLTGSIFQTILITYLMSSWLHGIKFHIWAVLLSLGFFNWIEHSLRGKLARHLDACILSRDCNGKCKHSASSIIVEPINLFFRVIAIAQLAYLGYIFHGDTDQADFRTAINSWSEIHFYGHYLALFIFALSNAIS